ncbi:MAG: glycosyltransferase family 2 protein [Cyanobacteria bacterium]|nr:glycosyltransferase family 2 protein [Cyanobacteriota bacterium]MDA1021574.1 glycosyltransferase family 2 protein [Cyanobacteriota bacterium]
MSVNELLQKQNDGGMAPCLFVLIPVFNEEASVVLAISEIKEVLSSLKNKYKTRIIIINDGSTDKTRQELEKIEVDKIITHTKNRGLGAAVRTGLNYAKLHGADFVIKIDADLQHDAKDILKLMNLLETDQIDLVYGNRFLGLEYKMPLIRLIGNKVFNKIMSFITGWNIEDGQPGLFGLNRQYLSCFDFQGDYNYTQQLLLDASHKNMRFLQTPISFRKRAYGDSFISFVYPFIVCYQIIVMMLGRLCGKR